MRSFKRFPESLSLRTRLGWSRYRSSRARLLNRIFRLA